MNHFNDLANSWDLNPLHRERSEAIAFKIKQKINLDPGMKALEYGSGTGILGFLLKDSLKEITLMDNSPEMVRVMEKKIKDGKALNLKPLCYNLEDSVYQSELFDLIFSQMVLHHIENVPKLLSAFYQMLFDGGKLAIADLYLEDGSFHGDTFNGHKGFDDEELGDILEMIGFKNVQHELCYIIHKITDENVLKEFPVFIITAEK